MPKNESAGVANFARENPVLVSAGAVAAGLLIGALVPKTRRSMIQAGRAAAEGAAEHGQTALQAVKEQLEQASGDGSLTEQAVAAGRAALDGAKNAASGAAGAVATVAERFHPNAESDTDTVNSADAPTKASPVSEPASPSTPTGPVAGGIPGPNIRRPSANFVGPVATAAVDH